MPISVDRVNDLLKKTKVSWFVFLMKKILYLLKLDFSLRIERKKLNKNLKQDSKSVENLKIKSFLSYLFTLIKEKTKITMLLPNTRKLLGIVSLVIYVL